MTGPVTGRSTLGAARPRLRSARLAPLVFACAFSLGSSDAWALLWPSETKRIERELTAPDVAVRRQAAARIRELPEAAATRAVLKALNDPDVEVRLLSLRAAKARGVAGLSDRVLPWLTEAEPRLRLAAAEALADEPSGRAVGPLSRALSDAEPQVRAAAAAALGASRASDAVIALLGRLDDSSIEVRESVVRALARLGDGRAVVPLISKIEDPRPSMRQAVARALGELGDRRAVSALVLALRDSDPNVRVRALQALGELGDPSATPSIAAVLGDDAMDAVRLAAIDALARLSSPDAVLRLVDALGAHAEERAALIRALGSIGAAAVPELTACLSRSENRERADGCAVALATTRHTEATTLILEALRRGRIGAEAALDAVAELGDPTALPLALEHLVHRDPVVRRAALAASAALLDPRRSDGRAVEPLELAFQRARAHRGERMQLLTLLGQTGSPRAARVLVPVADSADDVQYRLAAIEALGWVKAAGATDALLRALDDPEPGVRLTASLAIRKSAPRGAADALASRLERAGAIDRSAVALALGGALAEAQPDVVNRVARAAFTAHGGERDALIEALAHAPGPVADRALTAMARSNDPADRRKVAEGLMLRPSALALARSLAQDGDGAVRANAYWALGSIGAAADRPLLVRGLADVDVTAAANAITSLGRLATRLGVPVTRELCGALGDRRAAVRASALSALRVSRSRCEDRARTLLAEDGSVRVRVAAAELIRDVAADANDRRALRRCVTQEPAGAVAAACAARAVAVSPGESEVVVFVVPTGEPSPVPHAPFALRRPDSLVRHGRADRRGAVCEIGLPRGAITLDVPVVLEE